MIKSYSKERFLFQINAVLLKFLFKESRFCTKKKVPSNIKQHNFFSTLILIRNVSCVPNQHIIIISERSCDTEDWSNDAENSALPPQE